MKEEQWFWLLLIGLIIAWTLWPSGNSSKIVTVHAYSCVEEIGGEWHTAKSGNNVQCMGTERNLKDSSISFAIWIDNQRVIAKNSDGVIMKFNNCKVFNKNNWQCSMSDKLQWINWRMDNGIFSEMSSANAIGSMNIYFVSNVQYSGFWGWLQRFTNGSALKISQIKDTGG